MSVYEALQRAVALVEAGHCKGSYSAVGKDGFCYCAVGAISEASYGPHGFSPTTFAAATGLVRSILPAGFDRITEWNDHPDTTPRDVVELLSRAVEKARTQ